MKSRNEASRLLQKLTTQKVRDKRLTECLTNPERSHEDKDEWFIYVPACFNDCLDISKTVRKAKKVWTQGSRFAFHRGCILYDTPKAYHRWGDAIREIRYCISIHNGESVKLAEKKKEEKEKEEQRNPGSVGFAVLSPSTQSARLEEIGNFKLTQDEFVKFLIDGNPQIIPTYRIA